MRRTWLWLCATGFFVLAGVAAAREADQSLSASDTAPRSQTANLPSKSLATPKRNGGQAARPRRAPIKKKQVANSAAKRAHQRGGAMPEEVNTWLIFGFAEGSDVGQKGEWTIFHDSNIRTGQRTAGFSAWDGGTGIGYSVNDRAVISLGVLASTEWTATDFARGLGVVAGFKYQFLRRDEFPVGLAAQISPFVQRFDSSVTGHDAFGAEFRLIADRTLVPHRWFAALNLVYLPQHNAYTDGGIGREATVEASGALSRRLSGDVFVGAEIRYLNKFQGYGFDRFAGNALYLGPTLFVGIGENGYFGFAWSLQAASYSKFDAATRLDSEGFERHQFRLKAGISF